MDFCELFSLVQRENIIRTVCSTDIRSRLSGVCRSIIESFWSGCPVCRRKETTHCGFALMSLTQMAQGKHHTSLRAKSIAFCTVCGCVMLRRVCRYALACLLCSLVDIAYSTYTHMCVLKCQLWLHSFYFMPAGALLALSCSAY
jgi:hypothetical protein